MSATYSSFDTLTVGQLEGSAGLTGDHLPVLAEIPTVGRPPTVEKKTTRRPVDNAHPAPPAPQFEVAASPMPVAPERKPTPAPTRAPAPEPAPVAHSQWVERQESHWTSQLLELENAVRPHARLIALVALIALTGLTLVLLRAPVNPAAEAPPTDVVDAPLFKPAVIDHEATQVAIQQAPPAKGGAEFLAPIPKLPSIASKPELTLAPQATIIAVGPAGIPQQVSEPSPAEAITPIVVAEAKDNATRTSVAGPLAPASQPVRVAERTPYPTTNSSQGAWSPQLDSAAPASGASMPNSYPQTSSAGNELH